SLANRRFRIRDGTLRRDGLQAVAQVISYFIAKPQQQEAGDGNDGKQSRHNTCFVALDNCDHPLCLKWCLGKTRFCMVDAGMWGTAICPLKGLSSGFGASMLNPPMPGAIEGGAVVKGAKGDCKGEQNGLRCDAYKIKSSIPSTSIPAARHRKESLLV